jgi:hypothetical protein
MAKETMLINLPTFERGPLHEEIVGLILLVVIDFSAFICFKVSWSIFPLFIVITLEIIRIVMRLRVLRVLVRRWLIKHDI